MSQTVSSSLIVSQSSLLFMTGCSGAALNDEVAENSIFIRSVDGFVTLFGPSTCLGGGGNKVAELLATNAAELSV